jgi:hypothetical protein
VLTFSGDLYSAAGRAALLDFVFAATAKRSGDDKQVIAIRDELDAIQQGYLYNQVIFMLNASLTMWRDEGSKPLGITYTESRKLHFFFFSS